MQNVVIPRLQSGTISEREGDSSRQTKRLSPHGNGRFAAVSVGGSQNGPEFPGLTSQACKGHRSAIQETRNLMTRTRVCRRRHSIRL